MKAIMDEIMKLINIEGSRNDNKKVDPTKASRP
jgi:hypothetical protein